MNYFQILNMLIRFILIYLYLFLGSFSVLADSDKTLIIYHDADYSLNPLSAKAMKMGLLTAFDEVNNKIQGFRLEVKEKNHRGNIKRSLLTMKSFINDEKALFILGGKQSPPYIKNRQFINENQIPLLVPWAAGGPVTRYPSSNNWVFRLSIDDSKAGIRMSEYALNTLSCKKPHLLLENTAWGKSNERTMSSYLKGKVPFSISLFGWSLKENSARILLRTLIAKGHDCVFLVANNKVTNQFLKAMTSMDTDKIIPINGFCSNTSKFSYFDEHYVGSSRSISKSTSGQKIKSFSLLDIHNKYDISDACLKIDCEGCEYEILDTTPKNIIQMFSEIVLEFHNGFELLQKKLENYGFNVMIYPSKHFDDGSTGLLFAKRQK